MWNRMAYRKHTNYTRLLSVKVGEIQSRDKKEQRKDFFRSLEEHEHNKLCIGILRLQIKNKLSR